MPVRKNADLLASRYVELAGSLSPPIDMLSLASLAGARVVDGDHDLAGLTLRTEGGYVISLGRKSRGATTRLGRRARFTLAHEIGHIILDSSASLVEGPRALSPSVVEHLCDKIAETLLMPQALVNEVFVLRLHEEVTIGNVFQLAGTFDVSFEAAARRLSSLNLLGKSSILGWRYTKPTQGRHGELTCTWMVRNASDQLDVSPPVSTRDSCALWAFRNGITQDGWESVVIQGRVAACPATATPHGRSWVVEVLALPVVLQEG